MYIPISSITHILSKARYLLNAIKIYQITDVFDKKLEK